jgi:hypothetical protein
VECGSEASAHAEVRDAGALPCAPTPLAHAANEGLGVRAKKYTLAMLGCLMLLLPACQGRQSPRVRVDLARVAQAVTLLPALSPTAPLPAQAVARAARRGDAAGA